MNLARKISAFGFILTFLCICKALADGPGGGTDDSQTHENLPRLFRLFSKPKPPSDEHVTGLNPVPHMQNVFGGGSFGFQVELNPLRNIHNIVELGKKKVGFFLGQKRPTGGHIPKEEPNRPSKEHDYEMIEEGWKPQNPKDEVPRWEDIGEPMKEDPEENEDYGGTTIPIEDIIQPRFKPRSRPRRRIESKIYHVHLNFTSNAKPFQVKIQNTNELFKKGRDGKL
ncbi:uncharacterized protein LOC129225595 [Uloborus diversus]|uniref:uncharacterized protein LOC129225595 n=1 Tax=Uloborus diversus TaxID=327109 RepID=UPI00240A3933|nr:uncharacterized protein LOC129225595 [Uloborus diversus]